MKALQYYFLTLATVQLANAFPYHKSFYSSTEDSTFQLVTY